MSASGPEPARDGASPAGTGASQGTEAPTTGRTRRLDLAQAHAQRTQAARAAGAVTSSPGGASATVADDDIEIRLQAVLGDPRTALGEFTGEATPSPTSAAELQLQPVTPVHSHEPHLSEAPVQQATSTPSPVDDIEARLDAVLAPTAVPPPPDPTTIEPAPVMAAPAAMHQPLPEPAASIEHEHPRVGPAPTAASLLGIDVQRMAMLIEDEALGARQRIEIELRTASARAEEILGHAEHEAERIREHGQAQARVLLGEVEEIISEAQQTGEQILQRADQEAGLLRQQASSVLQQAQSEARAIVDGARREGEQVLAEQRRLATVRAQEALREQDRLKDQIRRLEERRRQVLESLEPLIAQLTQMMPTIDGDNVVPFDRQRTTGS